MGITRNITRSISKNIGTDITDQIISQYDSDALSYFMAVENAGGSFNLTSINPNYTINYVKSAHNTFIEGLKQDELWSKITELYLLIGKTYNGISVKFKGTGSLALENFIGTDYISSGSGAGLKGDGSTKRINTNFSANQVSNSSSHISSYITQVESSGSSERYMVGAEPSAGTNRLALCTVSNNTVLRYADDSGFTAVQAAYTASTDFRIGCQRSGDAELYINGSSFATSSNAASRTLTNINLYLFVLNRGGSFVDYVGDRMSLVSIGQSLSDTEAENFSNRVNALMTSFGANVY